MSAIHPRIRIVFVLALSLIISGICMKYAETTAESPVPHVEVANIVKDFSQNVSNTGTSIIASIQSIHIPEFVSFSLHPSSLSVQPTSAPTLPTTITPPASEWTVLPSSTPAPILPTIIIPPSDIPYLSLMPSISIPTTKPPTPTDEPAPTPVAPAEFIRPGKDLEDIFKKASELTCVSVPVLKALINEEGPGVLTYSDRWALFYNAYDWWHRVTEKQQVCSGYGYYPETGLIAPDSLFAGERCKAPFSPATANDTVSRSLGATQMLQYYWDKTYSAKTKQALGVDKVDRRVLLDSLVGFGINLKEEMKYSGSCDNWEFKYAMQAACINTGSAGDAAKWYCPVICNFFNKYANQNNDCSTSNTYGLFVPGSFCKFR